MRKPPHPACGGESRWTWISPRESHRASGVSHLFALLSESVEGPKT